MSYRQTYKNKRTFNGDKLRSFEQQTNTLGIQGQAQQQYSGYMNPISNATSYYSKDNNTNTQVQNYLNSLQQQNQNAYNKYIDTHNQYANANMVANAQSGANKQLAEGNINKQLQALGLGQTGAVTSNMLAINNAYNQQVANNNYAYQEGARKAYQDYMSQVDANNLNTDTAIRDLIAKGQSTNASNISALLENMSSIKDYDAIKQQIESSDLSDTDKQTLINQLDMNATRIDESTQSYKAQQFENLLGTATSLQDFEGLRSQIESANLSDEDRGYLTQLLNQYASQMLSEEENKTFNPSEEETPSTPPNATINKGTISITPPPTESNPTPPAKTYNVSGINQTNLDNLYTSLTSKDTTYMDNAKDITSFLKGITYPNGNKFMDEKHENPNQSYAIQALMVLATGDNFKGSLGSVNTTGSRNLEIKTKGLTDSQKAFLKELGFTESGKKFTCHVSKLDKAITDKFMEMFYNQAS